jgi:exosome complex exonuclease DIS3/RRP44
LSDEAVAEGIKSGRFHQGPMRQNADNWLEAIVQAGESFGEDILIKGRVNMNRAIDGDIVVVELFKKDQWESSSTVFVDVDLPDIDSLDALSTNSQKEKVCVVIVLGRELAIFP